MRTIFFLLFATTCSQALAQRSDSAALHRSYLINIESIVNGVHDFGSLVLSPAHWESRDWMTLSGIAGATAIAYGVDQQSRDFFQRNQSSLSRDIAPVARAFGDPTYLAAPLGAMYLVGYFDDNVRLRRASILTVESVTFAGFITSTIKIIVHRHRPYENDGRSVFDGPSLITDHLSFPSGHTTVAFAAATALAREFDDVPILPTIFYATATLTGLSRIHDDQHWLSDVVFGAAVGYFTASFVERQHTNRHGGEDFSFTFVPGSNARMQIAVNF